MHRLGLLGLDTSHGEMFANRLAEREDVDLAYVWDGGVTRDDAYTEDFCQTHGATRTERPVDMPDDVDGALILTVDWDQHVPLARPFLEADVPVLIDKPIVGSTAHLKALRSAIAESEATIFGGSAVPFYDLLAALPTGVANRSIFAAGYNDPFYYGVHLTDTLRRLAGADWSLVRPQRVGGDGASVEFDNGAAGVIRLDGPSADGTFAFLDVADRTRTITIPSDAGAFEDMYDRYLSGFIETIAGDRDDASLLLDAAGLLLGLTRAREQDSPICAADGGITSFSKSADPFVADYSPYY